MQRYLDYYHLESYLFDVVSPRFRNSGTLTAFDFFCIIIWKANRAKSKVAKRLSHSGQNSLEAAVQALALQVSSAESPKERLGVLMESWGFLLPMASAILTVLYPTDFTVYDVRVCEELNDFRKLKDIRDIEKRWVDYKSYCKAVEAAVSEPLSLRDKDRWLWGKSFATQLQIDIQRNFKATVPENATDA